MLFLHETNNVITSNNPLIVRVLNFIELNFNRPISLKDVAAELKYSPSYLTNLVKCKTGKTVNRWITERRLAEARYLLLKTNQSVEQIAYAVGYLDVSYFFRQFRRHHTKTPQTWRKSQI